MKGRRHFLRTAVQPSQFWQEGGAWAQFRPGEARTTGQAARESAEQPRAWPWPARRVG